MPVSININSAQIAMNIRAAADKTVEYIADKIKGDCNEYVPDDQEGLIDSSNNHSDLKNGVIRWATPYARYLYHGVLMVDPKTGSAWAREGQTKVLTSPEKALTFDKQKHTNAGSHWCERAQADHGEEWKSDYEKKFREELNK